MIKLDKFSLLVYNSNRFILINVTPNSIDILDKDGFLNGSSRMPIEFLQFLALISSDKIVQTNHLQNISCDSLSFCAVCFALIKKNYCFSEIIKFLETETCYDNILP